MRTRQNGLRAAAGAPAGAATRAAPGQCVRRADDPSVSLPGWRTADAPGDRLARLVTAPLHAFLVAVMGVVALVGFRRIRVLHRGRLPRHGAAIVVANHPATWTDVVLLDRALGRKLHFLTHEALYRPWSRALLLRVHGSLPVAPRDRTPGTETPNRRTFDRCQRLLARGEVVAVFAEGLSGGDRSVRPLRTGAARIALERAARAGDPVLLPVGLHYDDRTRFRCEAVVAVGEPIALGPPGAPDREAAAHGLTARLQAAIESLIVNAPDEGLAEAVADVAALLPEEADDVAGYERSLRAAAVLAEIRSEHPARFDRIRREARRLVRGLGRLGIPRGPVAAPWPGRVALGLAVALGAAPALAGLLLHAAPALAAGAFTKRFARDPSRVSFVRLASGLVLFPTAAALTAAAVLPIAGAGAALLALVAFPVLGMFAVAWSEWLVELVVAARADAARSRRPGLVSRLEARRRRLAALVTGSAGPDPASKSTA